MSKFMKIEVEAKLILTVPSAKDDEKAADVVLATEQYINKLHGVMIMDKPTFTHVGIRIHCHDYQVVSK